MLKVFHHKLRIGPQQDATAIGKQQVGVAVVGGFDLVASVHGVTGTQPQGLPVAAHADLASSQCHRGRLLGQSHAHAGPQQAGGGESLHQCFHDRPPPQKRSARFSL